MAKEILLLPLVYDMKLISQKKTIKKDFKAGVAKQIAPPFNSLNTVNAIAFTFLIPHTLFSTFVNLTVHLTAFLKKTGSL